MSKAISSLAALLIPVLAACSGTPDAPPYSGGFKVLEARSEPERIELSGTYTPKEPHQFLAEVKDSRATVVEVTLRLANVAMEIPMENVGGTLWRGGLSAEQLKTLAISGRQVEYKATIVARNDQGDVAVSDQPIVFDVKGPPATGTG
ncbi:MAG: hypothetical protein NDJ90_10285 [Oligoflexia bacterium]|nr:hypothetical protein [Oligoflexia bacterium]